MQNRDLRLWDYTWGEIIVEERFLPIINSHEFQRLKDKKQLGLTAKVSDFSGGQHTRYEHSIGTFHLAKLVINKCRKVYEINQEEEDAFLVAALLHDIGHGPFSHAFERISKNSHEQETFRKIETGELNDIIVSNFKEEVLNKVVQIFKSKERVNTKEDTSDKLDKFNFTSIMGELLSGAVDVDRLDYLTRDWLCIKGERVDFTAILNWMNIDIVNGRPRIVFDYQALGTLEKYFIHRFNSYNEIYLNKSGLVLDEVLEKFIKGAFDEKEINTDLTESEINLLIDNISKGKVQNYPYEIKRYAQILSTGHFGQIYSKEFRTVEERDLFGKALKEIIPLNSLDHSFYSTVKRSVSVYNKEKNDVLIQDDASEKLADISEISAIIHDGVSQDTILSFVDVNLLEHSLKKDGRFSKEMIDGVLEKVECLFGGKKIQRQKSFSFAERTDHLKEFEKLCGELGAEEIRDVISDNKYNKDSKGLLNTFRATTRICTQRKDYLIKHMGSTIEMSYSRSQIESERRPKDVGLVVELKKGSVKSLTSLINILNKRFKLLERNQSNKEQTVGVQR